jgi:hypothetical protein
MDISKKNMVLVGFLLSLISVTFNSVVISYVNARLKTVDDERTKLSDSLERQAAALSDGDAQFAVYRVMHNLEYAVPTGKAPDVQQDAVNQLQSALEKWYQSAYDVPQTEMTKADTEDFGQRLPIMEKDLQLLRAMQSANSSAEKAQLAREHEDLEKQLPEPTSDLVRKIRELQKNADDAENAASEAELFSTLVPVMKSFQAETLTSSEKKRSRISELQAERASLVTKSNYASYGAIAFQLLGLMFILARDLLSHKKAS